MARSRNWQITDFKLLDWNKIYSDNKDIIRFLGWGLEICPKTKKKHNQAWVQFKNPKRMGGLHKMAQSKFHCEVIYGTTEQNCKYCSKD